MREPVDQSELELRRATLAARCPPDCGPLLIAMFDVLVEHHGERISRDRVRSAYEAAGGTSSRRAFDGALARLRAKLSGATIHTLGRELFLEATRGR